VQEALRTLAAGEAKALVVVKLDRLSRSMIDFAAVMAKAQKQNWALVALDVAVDSSRPAGEAMVHMLATFAQFERRLIARRARDALAVKKASGVRLGRPPSLPDAVVRRIQRQRGRGDSFRKIAVDLNEARVPTAEGRAGVVRGDGQACLPRDGVTPSDRCRRARRRRPSPRNRPNARDPSRGWP
jgi:DNA invertase Pin-like site-specific DNA recombinase